ncbi:MAG: preprotein translocase subunit SecY, partial [Bradymonadia bacterium]
GNGISLIIFAGIVVGLPAGALNTLTQLSSGDMSPFQGVVLVIILLSIVAVIVFFERAQRRVPVQYAKSNTEGARSAPVGQTSYLPLKVNTAGVIPPIFASSLLLFPTTIASWAADQPWAATVQQMFTMTDWRYNVFYVALVIFFAFFYTAVTFNPVDVADNMKRGGSFVPGIRPGKNTAEYIDYVLTRITTGGAVYLAAVCVLPVLLQGYFPISFFYGGTGLLIVVSVGLDTVQQIEGHLLTREYEGLTEGRSERIRERVRKD